MANTFIDYNGNGSQTTFNYSFPILNESHVVVKVDNVKKTFNSDYTVSYNATTQSGSITLTGSAPASTSQIRIQRVSAPNSNLVDFVNGARLTESSLDTAYLHTRYLAEESTEISESALTTISSGGQTFLDAAGLEIRGAATPTQSTSVATKNYVDLQDDLKVTKASPEVTGALDMNNNRIHSLGQPVSPNHATTKTYVDGEITTLNNSKLPKSGGTLASNLAAAGHKITNLGTPTDDSDASTKKYVDDRDAEQLSRSGGSLIGHLYMSGNQVKSVGNPTANQDATNKQYVDGEITTLDNDKLSKSGGQMSGSIRLHNDPSTPYMAATKNYVDTRVSLSSTNLTTFQHQTFTGNGSATSFNWTGGYTPATFEEKAYIVSIDGVLQPPTSYTINEGNITFPSAPPNSSAIHVVTAAGAETINFPATASGNNVTFNGAVNSNSGAITNNLTVGGTLSAGDTTLNKLTVSGSSSSSSINGVSISPVGHITGGTFSSTGLVRGGTVEANYIRGPNNQGAVQVQTGFIVDGQADLKGNTIIGNNTVNESSQVYMDTITKTNNELRGYNNAIIKVPSGIYVNPSSSGTDNGIYYGGLNISDYRRREFTYTSTGANRSVSDFGASGLPNNFGDVFDNNGYVELFSTAFGVNPLLGTGRSKFRFEVFLNLLMEKEDGLSTQSRSVLTWELCRQSTNTSAPITVIQAGFLTQPNSTYSSYDNDYIVNPQITTEITPALIYGGATGARYFFRLKRSGAAFDANFLAYWLNWEKYWDSGALANTFKPCSMIFTEVPIAQ